MRIQPGNRLILLLVITSPVWIIAVVRPSLSLIPAAVLALQIAAGLIDFLRLPDSRKLAGSRVIPARLSLYSEHSITLSVTNNSGMKIMMEIRDDVPECLTLLSAESGPMMLEAGDTAELRYTVKANSRGYARFSSIFCRIYSPLRLAGRQVTLPIRSEGKVYPHFLGVDQYNLLAMIDRREEARKTVRQTGGGMDLESLRQYVPGEDPRSIEWKVSARRGTLISRNFQVEKGRQLTILIDSGRFMLERLGHAPRFDHALDAAVMLSYVAQKRGDSVSVACFSNRIESYLPMSKGHRIMPRVLDSLFDVQPRNVESDYWHVFAQILSGLRKRSLIVLLCEVLDRAGSSGLIRNLDRAARKHLVLCVVLSDERICAMADQVPNGLSGSYEKAAASHVLLERSIALDDMRSRGIMVLETTPEHFSIQLIRRYLEIRKTGRL